MNNKKFSVLAFTATLFVSGAVQADLNLSVSHRVINDQIEVQINNLDTNAISDVVAHFANPVWHHISSDAVPVVSAGLDGNGTMSINLTRSILSQDEDPVAAIALHVTATDSNGASHDVLLDSILIP